MHLLDWLPDDSGLSPHGFCLTWQPGLLAINAGSDAVTMLAYYSIPLTLLWFLRRRRDLPHAWIGALFIAFIVACGTTHAMSILTLWVPAYPAEGAVKLITAALSIATAIMLWPLVPKLLATPSASQMAALNQELRATVAEQDRTAKLLGDSEQRLLVAQETMRRSNEELERRVAERTAELVRLNETIGKNEARFRGVVEAAPNGIVMVDAAGAIEMVNAQAERMFGYARNEMLGRPIEMLLPERFRNGHPAQRTGFFTRPTSRPMGGGRDLYALRKDGSEFRVEIGLNPIETEQGISVLSAIVDISARVKMEAQLRQSQKMEAVGRLTAGVAHDFNNLLQALGGSLELVQDEVADRPMALEYAQIAHRAALRGGELTNRLLAFSRQQVLKTRPVPIRKLLDDAEQLIGHLFDGNTEIVVLPGPVALSALADAAQLEAAIINLAVNARDAMTPGGRLRISAYEAEADPAMALAPGRYTVIAVADTGAGMDEATLAQACEPFFSTKGLNGSGLGLSMVQGFARQSDGDVRIISAPGQGTTVEIWLQSATVLHAPPPPEPVRQQAHGRVLLVDDAPDVLLTVGAFLRQAGLEVTRVENGDLAMARLLAGERFNAIVTDFAMPGLNGLDLLVQARELDPSMGGLIITGFSSPEMLRGLDHLVVLRKPFSRAELIEQVSQLIEVGQRA